MCSPTSTYKGRGEDMKGLGKLFRKQTELLDAQYPPVLALHFDV
jgi:hypothetical protein